MNIEKTQTRQPRAKGDTLEIESANFVEDAARIAANLAHVATDGKGNRIQTLSPEDMQRIGTAYGVVNAGVEDDSTKTSRWLEKVDAAREGIQADTGSKKGAVDAPSRRQPGPLKKAAMAGLIAYGVATGVTQAGEAVRDHYADDAETSVVIPDATVDVWHNGTWTEYPDNPNTPSIGNSVFSDIEPLPGTPDSAFSGVGGDYSSEVPTTPNKPPTGSSEWPEPIDNDIGYYDPFSDGMNNTGDPIDLPLEVEPIKPDDSPDSPENPATSADHSSSPEIKLYPDTPQQN